MIVEDARHHPRFAGMPITESVDIGAYIGAPIFLSDGTIYGTLCAIDPEPHKFAADDIVQLVVLARLMGLLLEQDMRGS